MGATNLLDFLKARIQEDEDTARAAARAAEDGYNIDPPWEFDGDEVVAAGGRGIITGPWGIEHEIARHVERYQPARVLREVEAKRAILEDHQIKAAYEVEHGDQEFGCERCYSDDLGVLGFGYCPTLKALAAIYSDHPSYREEWKP